MRKNIIVILCCIALGSFSGTFFWYQIQKISIKKTISEYIDNQLLVYGAHTFVDCTNAGGTLVDDTESSMKFCHFTGATCPVSWIQYKNWSVTTPLYCSTYIYDGWTQSCGGCTTAEHSTFIDQAPETCKYNSLYPYSNTLSTICSGSGHNNSYGCRSDSYCTCTATISSIGCY